MEGWKPEMRVPVFTHWDEDGMRQHLVIITLTTPKQWIDEDEAKD